MGFVDKLRQLATLCLPRLAHYVYGDRQVVASIEIAGDGEFCRSVKEAILLLEEKDLLTFQLVSHYLRFIVRSGKTFLKPLKTSSLLAIQESEVKNNSQAWLACLVAWYGHCSKLYFDSNEKDRKPGKVSWERYIGGRSWDFMYDCLKKMGGTYEETQHLADFIKEEREGRKKEEG